MPTLAGPDTHAEPDNDRAHRCVCSEPTMSTVGHITGREGYSLHCYACGGSDWHGAPIGDCEGDPTLDDHRDAGAELLRRELAWARRKLTVGFDPARRAALVALRNYRELLGIAEPI